MERQPGKHAENAKEFYLKEYECLRKEVELLLEDHRTLERNVVIAVGATWGWLFNDHHNNQVTQWGWFIPCLFALLGIVRVIGNAKFFLVTNAYIEKIEDAFFSTGDPGGWDHFSFGKTWIRQSTIAFWSILLISTFVVAVYEFRCP
jgi:hypothetical protein